MLEMVTCCGRKQRESEGVPRRHNQSLHLLLSTVLCVHALWFKALPTCASSSSVTCAKFGNVDSGFSVSAVEQSWSVSSVQVELWLLL